MFGLPTSNSKCQQIRELGTKALFWCYCLVPPAPLLEAFQPVGGSAEIPVDRAPIPHNLAHSLAIGNRVARKGNT